MFILFGMPSVRGMLTCRPGEWVTEDYVYKGHFDEHLPVGRGKFIFDKGPRPTAQHGW